MKLLITDICSVAFCTFTTIAFAAVDRSAGLKQASTDYASAEVK